MVREQQTAALVVCGATVVMTLGFLFNVFLAREATKWIEGRHHWFIDHEPWSLVGFGAVFFLGTAFFLPAQPFTVAIGYIYGLTVFSVCFVYFVEVMTVFTLFMMARHWFRPILEVWLNERNLLLAHGMAAYLKNPWEGAKVNLLLSFVPVALCVHVYVMAVSEIDTWVFIASFVLGATLQIILTLLTGSTMMAADASSSSLDNIKVIMMAVGVVGTFVAIVYIGSIARDVLKRIEEDVSRHGLINGPGEVDVSAELGLKFLYDSPNGQLMVASKEPHISGWKVEKINSGDVLFQVDGRAVGSHQELLNYLSQKDGSNLSLMLKGPDGAVYDVMIDRHLREPQDSDTVLVHVNKEV